MIVNILTCEDNEVELSLDVDNVSGHIGQILSSYGDGELRQMAEETMEAGMPYWYFAGKLNTYNYKQEVVKP